MAKSGKSQKKYRLTIAAIVAVVGLVVLAVVCIAIVVSAKVNTSLNEYYFPPVKQTQAFEISIPLGMPMDEVREIHGDPDSIILPYQLYVNHDLAPRGGDPTTVWHYELYHKVDLLDAAYLHFNDDGKLVRVHLIRS